MRDIPRRAALALLAAGAATLRLRPAVAAPAPKPAAAPAPKPAAEDAAGPQPDDAIDETWLDSRRNRVLPVRIRWPRGGDAQGVIVFSHGLGGNRAAGTVWGQAWRDSGFLVIHVQHPGSDTDALFAGPGALKRAASVEQLQVRVQDAHFVIDEIERRRALPSVRGEDDAWRHVRTEALGFCGHSFGSRTTLAVAGERVDAGVQADPRPRAFIAFSPGFNAREGKPDAVAARHFSAISRPVLCVTGSLDDRVMFGDADQSTRRAVYRGLPAGNKAELVLAGADHMTFGGQTGFHARMGPLKRAPMAVEREDTHHAVVARITTDWWRWRLLGDLAARDRLHTPAGLIAADTWRQG